MKQTGSSSEEDRRYKLNKKFFLSMIHLEKQFAKKVDSMQQILDLIDMYGKCVEFLDTLGNPAKFYFMEKIADTLTEAQAFELILTQEEQVRKQQEKAKQVKPIIKHENNNHDPLKRPVQQQTIKEIKPITMKIPTSMNISFKEDSIELNSVSLTKNRQVRQKKLTLTEQMFEQKVQLNEQSNIIQQWDAETNQNDSIIKDALKQQETTIMNRINERKQKRRQRANNNLSLQSLDPMDISISEITNIISEMQE